MAFGVVMSRRWGVKREVMTTPASRDLCVSYGHARGPERISDGARKDPSLAFFP
jgi:hypothetical protein